MTREQGTGNREQGRGFGQLYFSLLMSVFFRSPTYTMKVAGNEQRKILNWDELRLVFDKGLTNPRDIIKHNFWTSCFVNFMV
ncbi:MAG: hypothetical protein ACK6A9_08005 [Dolichospermum sp.]